MQSRYEKYRIFPIAPPPGCRFHTRCFMAKKECAEVCPLLREVAPGRFAACHFV